MLLVLKSKTKKIKETFKELFYNPENLRLFVYHIYLSVR